MAYITLNDLRNKYVSIVWEYKNLSCSKLIHDPVIFSFKKKNGEENRELRPIRTMFIKARNELQ